MRATGRRSAVRALRATAAWKEAIRILIRSDNPSDRAYLGYAVARSGRREEAEELAIDLSPKAASASVDLCRLER